MGFGEDVFMEMSFVWVKRYMVVFEEAFRVVCWVFFKVKVRVFV